MLGISCLIVILMTPRWPSLSTCPWIVCLVVEKGISADDRILEIARDQGLRVVTNDRFRDWKGTYPMIGKKGFFVRGSFKGGNVQWQSI